MFQQVSPKAQPGMGVFPPDWLDTTFMPQAVRKVTTAQTLRNFSLQNFLLQYGDPMGDPAGGRICPPGRAGHAHLAGAAPAGLIWR